MLAVSGGKRLGGKARRRQGKRQRGRERDMAAAARDYAALGWPCTPGAHPGVAGDRACSCDRVGCPDPGAHPA